MNQLLQIISEFKYSDVLATYNMSYKNKILLCGPPCTGKTFTAQIISSVLNIPLVYIRFDTIISSYLVETANNLKKVFDFLESDVWIVLFDEFNIIAKNRNGETGTVELAWMGKYTKFANLYKGNEQYGRRYYKYCSR